MEVKGSAVGSLRSFIKENFGDEEFEHWLSRLTAQQQSTFRNDIPVHQWFDLSRFLVEPTRLMCEMFYEGNLRGAWACGMYSADSALHGILRFFVKLGTPSYIVRRASEIIRSYYKPSDIVSEMKSKNSVHLTITYFPDMDPVVEARICGWVQRALEINGCSNVRIEILSSLVNKDDCTRFNITWD